MTLSLLLVYLHDMRGFSNTFGGLLLAYASIVSIVASTPLGALVDRFGPRKVIIPGLLAASGGTFSLSNVDTHFEAILALSVINIAGQAIWPTQMVILTRLTPEKDRQKIFGFNFMLLNLGLGIGGLISSLLIREGDLRSFQLMYWIDAATFLLYLSIVLTMRGPAMKRYVKQEHEPEQGSYRDLLANKPLVLLGLSGIILFTFGYGSITAGVPLFATQYLDLSPNWLGIIFGVNTFAIVIFQPLVLNIIEKYSKYTALIAVAVIWALSWVAVGVSPYLSMFMAGVALCISQLIFAFGEMVHAPTSPALMQELTPEHIRGRASALMSLQWGISGIAGPAIAGLMIGAHLEQLWVLAMALGVLIPMPLFAYLKRSTENK